MNNRYIWFAFGIGAAAGAAVALLYAPQTGVKTRKQLRKGIDEATDYLEDAGDYLKDQADKLTKETQKVVKQTATKATELAESAVDLSNSAAKAVTALF